MAVPTAAPDGAGIARAETEEGEEALKNSRAPWWCIPFQGIALAFMLAACVGLFVSGFGDLTILVIFGTGLLVALWVLLKLPAQARKEGRSLPLRLLICAGMLLACWLLPELLMWVFGTGVSYWTVTRYCLMIAFIRLGFI